jgi:glycosyltransferase involved in cell wall biosynthesis
MSDELDVAFYQPWIGPLLTSAPGTATGGAETHVLLVARELARRGHRVGVVTWPVASPLPGNLDGVRVVPLPRLRRVFPIGRLLRLAAVVATVGRLDTRALVQKNAEFDTGLVGLVARLRRRRFVWAASNVIDFDYARIERSRTNRAAFRLGVRLAQQRVVQTEEQRRLCAQRFGLPATIIKNPGERLPARSGPGQAFLWSARLAPYKRPEAYVELARALPEARFWMVALATNDSERARLEELHEVTARIPNLELLPPRPRAELLDLMSSAVAVVNTAEFEGMSNVLLESWSTGVPALVLAHDPDGVVQRERLGGFAGGSQERLVQLARGMWESRDNQAELAARCRDYVRREHDIEAVATRWEQVLGLGADPPSCSD